MTQRTAGRLTYNTGARLCYGFFRHVLRLVDELGLGASVVEHGRMPIACRTETGRYPIYLSAGAGLLKDSALPAAERVKLLRILPDLLHARARVDPASLGTSAAYDGESLAAYILRKVGPHFLERHIEPVFRATRSWNPEDVSAAFFVAVSSRTLGRNRTFGFKQGIGQLTAALASRLDVRYGADVQGIERDHRSGPCRIRYRAAGQEEERSSDLVVVAVEGARVAGMLTEPTDEEHRFFAKVRYNSLGVIHAESHRPLPSRLTFFSRSHPSGLSILEIAGNGPRSRIYCQLAPESVLQALRERRTGALYGMTCHAIERICPELRIESATVVNQWIEHMLPTFYPGYLEHVRAFLERQRATPRRVYFCGDYLAQALVEGACYSGESVAGDVARHWLDANRLT